jgi:carboxyl-terminal processing protease
MQSKDTNALSSQSDATGRLLVNKYDDSRWFGEQPDATSQSQLPSPPDPSPDDFDHHPFLPTPEQPTPEPSSGTITPAPQRSQPVSKYDTSGWFGEQTDTTSQSQLPPPSDPSPDDFDHYPFLPTPEPSPGTTTQAPRRSRHLLAQVLLTLALVVLAFGGGWFAHQYFSSNSFDQSNQSRAYSQLIQQAWDDIDKYYVDRKAIDYKKMSYAAISAMVTTLGDTGHSRFMDPQTVKNENQQLSGKFIGIGVYLHQDATTKQLTITAPIPNSPADKAGIKPGDILLTVNGTNMKGKNTNDASMLIRGQEGTNVTLTIQRPNTQETLTFTLTRAQIRQPNVIMHYIPESHIAHIQMLQFSAGVSNDLRDAITNAKNMGATKIILDLRNNPGGYLNEAINTSSLFIKSGNVLLEQNRTGQRTPFPVNGNPQDTTSQMVVLVNRYSASAAEIVTAALKENNRATIIGETTFGTGTVLEQFNLADGSALYLGTQEWLTPNGHFIRQIAGDPNSGGVKPTITVVQDPNKPILTANEENMSHLTQQDILNSGDAQLAAAIQFLNK